MAEKRGRLQSAKFKNNATITVQSLLWRKYHTSVFMRDYSSPITVENWPTSLYPAGGNERCLCSHQSYLGLHVIYHQNVSVVTLVNTVLLSLWFFSSFQVTTHALVMHCCSTHCFSVQHEITVGVDWLPWAASA